jgi:type I restriction enzyme, S subunit
MTNKKNEDYKNTELRYIPESWKVVKFEEVLNLFNGYAFKSTDAVESSNTQLIRMGNLYQNKLDLDRNPVFYPDSYAQKYSKYILKEGDLIISLTGTSEKEDYGFTVKINKTDKKLLLNQRVARIDVISANVNGDYIFYFLRSRIFLNPLYLTAKGMKQANLSTNTIKKLNVLIPPLEEQRKIARVLSLVQDAIAQQEQLITLTTELKKPLMQKLFTEGTRNETQKMTEIGLIPDSWDVIPLVKIAKVGNGATPKKDNHEYWANGNIPWLTSTKIHESIIAAPDQYVTQKAVEDCHLPLVRAGSLLVAITGQGKTLGNSALVEFDTRINQHLAYIQFNEPKVVPIFILAFLQSRYQHFRQIARAGGSTKAALTCGFLKSYPVPLPKNKQEQLIIGQVFSSLNNKISIYESKIILLQDLFRTLLHQLMTAQIRVDDLNLSTLNLESQGGNE